MRNLGLLLLALVFVIVILLGGTMMFLASRQILLGLQGRKWPTTIGTLLTVESKDTSDSDCNSREILVRYSYSVDERVYESSTIHPSYASSRFEQAHSGLESLLQPTQQVLVYYDSRHPHQSMISVGFYSSSLGEVFFGHMFLGTLIWMLLAILFLQKIFIAFTFASFLSSFLLAMWFWQKGNHDFSSNITIVK